MAERILIVKVRRPDQAARVELYGRAHKYPDLKVDLSELAAVGIEPATLAIGQETPARFWCVYELSERLNKTGNPYKDLVALESVAGPATATSAAVGDPAALQELRAIRALLAAIAEGQGLTVPPAPAEPEPETEGNGAGDLDEFFPRDEPEPEPEPEGPRLTAAPAPSAGRPWAPEVCRAFVRKCSQVWIRGPDKSDLAAWQTAQRDQTGQTPPAPKQVQHVAAVMGKAATLGGQMSAVAGQGRREVLRYLFDVQSTSNLSRQELDAVISLWSQGGAWEANAFAAAECAGILELVATEAARNGEIAGRG